MKHKPVEFQPDGTAKYRGVTISQTGKWWMLQFQGKRRFFENTLNLNNLREIINQHFEKGEPMKFS